MRFRHCVLLVFAGLSTLAVGCLANQPPTSGVTPEPQVCPVVVPDANCDTSERPIVFVHGTFGSGDNIDHVAQLFGSNGYCQSRFVAIDYNSLGGDPTATLDAMIDKIRAQTGFDKVDLAGHSQGAFWCVSYLSDAAHAAKVAHYVQLAGGSVSAPPGGVATLSISSQGDTLAGPGGVTGADKTVVETWQDHMAVAGSTETFVNMYKYLEGKDPQYATVQCGSPTVTLEGKAESFGDNTVPVGGRIDVYEVGNTPFGATTPVTTFNVDSTGTFGPFKVKRYQEYEFRGFDAQGNIIGHLYYAPFKRSDYLMRLLVPSQNVLAEGVTNAIVRSDSHVALVARAYDGAFRYDRGDSLAIDGKEVLFDGIANDSTVTVGLFMFDDNNNMKSDGGSLSAYALLPFVKGTDVYMQATTPAFITLDFNGHVIKVPNWPSQSQGLVSVVFP